MNFFEKAQARARALEVLGLTGHPDIDELRAAYKKLAFENHPDRNGGSEAELLKINAAYALLKEDRGFTAADQLRPMPMDVEATTFREEAGQKDGGGEGADAGPAKSRPLSDGIAPRRVRTVKTSRIMKIDQAEAEECRTLLDEVTHMAEPDPDEMSLRARIVSTIRDSGAPFIPHTNHLPFAIRQTGRRISYMVKGRIAEGVNRVAVPTGVFCDKTKALPIIVRFKASNEGSGTHAVAAATLAEAFPGAKSVRIHFGLDEWPMHGSEAGAA